MQASSQLAICDKISMGLRLSQEYPLHEKPEKLYFGGEMLSGEGFIFNPLPGFHFGACGALNVHSPVTKSVRCDLPIVIAFLVLDGSFSYKIKGGGDAFTEVHKNMFLLGRCGGVEVDLFFPAQDKYSHIGFIVQESSLDEIFGEKAGTSLRGLLDETMAKSPEDTTLLSGIASPDAVSIARQLHEMQGAGPLDLLCCRCTALHFFAKLFSQAAMSENAPQILLHEQDKRRLAELKENIESNFLTIGSAAEACTTIGMSFSKANKAFRALYSTTIAQYIQYCKMSHAYSMLVARKLNVSECAFEVGYSNVSHFISAFKKQYNLTPKAASRLG